jgi:MbtH protein
MPGNPFDEDDGAFCVLINDEGQHSLWPAFAAVPAGWTVALGGASRRDCLEYTDAHWTDLRPKRLVEWAGHEDRRHTRG